MNPDIKDTINREQVEQSLLDLCEFAIEIPKHFQTFQMQNKELELYLEELSELKTTAIQ